MTKKERHELKLSLRHTLKGLIKNVDTLPDGSLLILSENLTELKTKVLEDSIKQIEESLK